MQSKNEQFNNQRDRSASRKTRLILASFLLAQVATFGCSKTESPQSISYLALGDSCTVGESVESQHSFPNLLVARLRENGLRVDTPVVVAKTGWTTEELSLGIDSAGDVNSRQFDFVTLLIGANNQFRGQSFVRYQREFVSLLKRSIELADGDSSRVFVISICPTLPPVDVSWFPPPPDCICPTSR